MVLNDFGTMCLLYWLHERALKRAERGIVYDPADAEPRANGLIQRVQQGLRRRPAARRAVFTPARLNG